MLMQPINAHSEHRKANSVIVPLLLLLSPGLCQPFCDPVDCSPPGSSVQEVSQARNTDVVCTSFSRGTSQPRSLDGHVDSLLLGHRGNLGSYYYLSVQSLPSDCISLEILFTSSCDLPSVITTMTLGMPLLVPDSAVNKLSRTCLIAFPETKQGNSSV